MAWALPSLIGAWSIQACGGDGDAQPAAQSGGATSSGGINGSGGSSSGGITSSGGSSTGGSGNGGASSGGAGSGGAAGSGGSSSGGAPPDSGAPKDTLADTGLYAAGGGETLATGVRAYEVRYELWSDGAVKKRFLYLPPGTKIDTTDIDQWVFPVGTKVWKEFTRDGKRVETRLLEKTSNEPDIGWKRVAYAWNAAQTEAVAVPDGQAAALGTAHDIPTQDDCYICHVGSKDFVLGVSAIQLAHDRPGVTLQALVDQNLLTAPPASTSLPLPGSAVEQAALGTLHANCGICHRPGTIAYERAKMDLNLEVGSLATVQGTSTYQTTVNVATTKSFENVAVRIAPRNTAGSAVYQRMATRNDLEAMAMPPVASKVVDTAGLKALADWIASLNP